MSSLCRGRDNGQHSSQRNRCRRSLRQLEVSHMLQKLRFAAVTTLLAIAVITGQGTWVLAGTTGALNGVVSSKDGTPLAGVKVTASSPSESVSTISSSTGNFSFVSLVPDTY